LYLALKWFYNEKTKRYYSEELLKEIKDSMGPDWRKKYMKEVRVRV